MASPNATKLHVTEGQRFGRGVVIIPEIRTTTDNYRYVRLRCDCGNEYQTRIGRLFARSPALSCGCLAKERLREHSRSPENVAWLRSPEHRERLKDLTTSHGLTGHPLYGTWKSILDRCEHPRHDGYPNYGGRGIRVCPEWHDVARFISDIEREIGPRPEGMTLDRADNTRHYEPGNVRWATSGEQACNRRTVKLSDEIVITVRERYARGADITDMAREYGVWPGTMKAAVTGRSWKHVEA